MATKVQAQKFQKINKSGLSLKDAQHRSRTGQYTGGKKAAHNKIYKH